MARNSTRTLEILDELLEIFGEEYEKLYEEDENYLSWDKQEKLINKFDSLINKDKVFKLLVTLVSSYRQDFFSSDRECVAFMLAIKKFNLN